MRDVCTCCGKNVVAAVARRHATALAKHTPLPVECMVCETLVMAWGVKTSRVHHLDENPWNNDPSNLAVLHPGCHAHVHHSGVIRSSITRERIRARALGRPTSDHQKATASLTHLGKPKSAETREKMRLASLKREAARRA